MYGVALKPKYYEGLQDLIASGEYDYEWVSQYRDNLGQGNIKWRLNAGM